MKKDEAKSNGLVVALLITLIVCIIAAIALLMLDMLGIIGNTGGTGTSSAERETTKASDVSTTSVPIDTTVFETEESYEVSHSGETPVTGETPVDTTEKSGIETTTSPKDETTAKPTPETTTLPKDETTAKPTPETTVEPGHKHTWHTKTIKESTCTEEGILEGYCNCGAIKQFSKPTSHKSGKWESDATCTEDGYRYLRCIYCGMTMQKVAVAATGHAEKIDKAKLATCTENGLTEGKHCVVCNAVIVAQETIPALGHDEGDWVVKNATATQDGKKTITCRRCGEITKTEIIPANGYSEGLNFRLNDDGEGYTVVGIGDCKDTNLVIPSEYKGLPVTTIGSSAFKSTSYSGGRIKSVVFPSSVVSVQSEAFCNQRISEIVWGGVVDIGSSAFADCDYLTQLSISNKIKTIGASAFNDCDDLTKIVLSDSVISIGVSAFASCNNLQSITFGKNVETVGENAFSGCSNLTDVRTPDVESWCKIDFSATLSWRNDVYMSNPLYYAHHLYLTNGERVTDIVLNNKIKKIGSCAFAYCTGLKSIKISNSVLSIGTSAFIGCTNLTSLLFDGDSVKRIDSYAFFSCTALSSLTIPGSVVELGECLFEGCTELKTVILEYGIPDIGSAFHNSQITHISIPGSVISIPSNSFLGCDDLKEVVLENGVKEIQEKAFYEHKALSKVVFCDSLQTIGAYAFYYCTNISAVELNDNLKSIQWGAFGYTNISSITIPKGVIELESAFPDCPLQEVYFADGLQAIGDGWFAGYSTIRAIHIPSSVTYVGSNAFYRAYGLNYIYIEDIASWCNIEFNDPDFYFFNAKLVMNGKIVTTLTIPEGVNKISRYAFNLREHLEALYIPKSVTEIGWEAFYECRNLSSVYYQGTMEEWKNVKLGGNWKWGSNIKVIHCSDGDIKV